MKLIDFFGKKEFLELSNSIEKLKEMNRYYNGNDKNNIDNIIDRINDFTKKINYISKEIKNINDLHDYITNHIKIDDYKFTDFNDFISLIYFL